MIKVIRSHLLMMKAASLQGRCEFESVISLSERVLQHHPTCEIALAFLAENLKRLGRFEEAKKVLAKAVECHPENAVFNILYAQTLEKDGCAKEQYYPYAKAYVENRSSKWPSYFLPIARLLGLGEHAKSDMNRVDQQTAEKVKWANQVVNEVESETNH